VGMQMEESMKERKEFKKKKRAKDYTNGNAMQ